MSPSEMQAFCDARGWALPKPMAPADQARYQAAGLTSLESSPRQGADWLPREDYDLVSAFSDGVHQSDLAVRHRRTQSAIRLRLRSGRALAGAAQHLKATS